MARSSVAPNFWKRPRLTLLSLNAPKKDLPLGSFAADPEITETVIRLRRLPAALEGLRIVHLTDIHLSLFTPIEEVHRVVELANRLHPDLVALTGDYVTFSPQYIWPVAQALGRLRARRRFCCARQPRFPGKRGRSDASTPRTADSRASQLKLRFARRRQRLVAGGHR